MIDLVVAFVTLYIRFNSAVALSLGMLCILYFTISVLMYNRNVKPRRKMNQSGRRERRILHQAVEGWPTVAAFNMFSFEESRYGKAVDKFQVDEKRFSSRAAINYSAIGVLSPSMVLILGGLIIYDIRSGHSTPGDFVFFMQFWGMILYPVRILAYHYRTIQDSFTDAERLIELLKTLPKITDKEGAIPLPRIDGNVRFNEVNFSYDDHRISTRNITLSASSGETIGLVGATGSGKSTLMKLLMRLYDINSGQITLDGYDIRDITKSSLADSIGVVPQEPMFFNTTIMKNLRYAKPSATEEEIHEACRAAAIHEKILTFTHGYNTVVGENGVKLSGGERQRLAIARVFLKNPAILILDEATSSVDTKTESEVQKALDRICTHRTTFIIAHRLSTIVNASQILVLSEGEIIERGTHQELLQKRGEYAELWQEQTKTSKD